MNNRLYVLHAKVSDLCHGDSIEFEDILYREVCIEITFLKRQLEYNIEYKTYVVIDST